MLERCISCAADGACAEAAYGFVNGNDAADFGGIGSLPGGVVAEQFELRIDHFHAGRTEAVHFDFAVQHHELAGLEAALQIPAVKKFAGERKTGFVFDEQVIDGIASSHAPDGRTAGDAHSQGVDVAGADIFDVRKVDAVLVSERQIAEKVFESIDATVSEQFGALRADAFEHAHVSFWTFGHVRFISSARRKAEFVRKRRVVTGLLAWFGGRMKQWCAFGVRLRWHGFVDLSMAQAEAQVGRVQLGGSEKRALILWVLAGIAGLWYAGRHFFEAFPEASVNFKVTRDEALDRARNFVESLGNTTSGYRAVIVFGVNDNAKTYLEREVGLKEANRLMASEVNVWHWNVRFFKPEQEEEFQVAVSPEGRITGYLH